MNAHQWDRESGGCVCGSEWSREWRACSTEVRMFADEWVNAQAWFTSASEDMTPDDYFECGKGHMHCTRH